MWSRTKRSASVADDARSRKLLTLLPVMTTNDLDIRFSALLTAARECAARSLQIAGTERTGGEDASDSGGTLRARPHPARDNAKPPSSNTDPAGRAYMREGARPCLLFPAKSCQCAPLRNDALMCRASRRPRTRQSAIGGRPRRSAPIASERRSAGEQRRKETGDRRCKQSRAAKRGQRTLTAPSSHASPHALCDVLRALLAPAEAGRFR
jgi:hypothetical protein